MGDEMDIRTAVPGDETALAGLAAIVHQLHVAERPDVFKPVNLANVTEWFRVALLNPDLRILVAELSPLVVGYAVARDATREEDAFARSRRWREIDQLAVLPSYRRRGVARALVEAAAASALADGFPGVELATWAFNEAARTAFRRLGFIERIVRYELRAPRDASAVQPRVAADGAAPRR